MASISGEFSVVHYFEAAKKKALEESKKNLILKDTAEIECVESCTDAEETNVSDMVSVTKKLNKEKEADNV